MKARLIGGGFAMAIFGGAMAVGTANPAAAADTGIPVLEKIKMCESGGDYTAENPTSTASGAYQFIDGTWRSLDASAGYSRASDAPAAVQDAAAIELYNASGTSPWNASAHCWQASGAAGPATERNTEGNGNGASDQAAADEAAPDEATSDDEQGADETPEPAPEIHDMTPAEPEPVVAPQPAVDPNAKYFTGDRWGDEPHKAVGGVSAVGLNVR